MLKLFARGIFFSVDLQCPLISGRCNGRVNGDSYPTMSGGIFDSIFPIVHKTFLLISLEAAGSWIFFVLKVCGHIMKRLSSWRQLFFFWP